MFIDVRECGNARCALKTRSPLALEQASPATKPRPAANYFSDETPALARDAVAISLASAYDWRGRSRRERSDRGAGRPALRHHADADVLRGYKNRVPKKFDFGFGAVSRHH